LALQCDANARKAGWIGKEADAAYALCEQALAIDPNNVRALMNLGAKFLTLWQAGLSSDPKGDLERADELESKALALDPSNVGALAILGFDYGDLGEFDKSLEYFDKGIRVSPHDPYLVHFYGGKAWANFALKNYYQAIEAGR
jgi:adenylate cyclase